MPLGPAVQNVRVYVVDENLAPVPLGAPGLICFSGVCVGRGYINDPERTAQTYLSDPHRPGERLYQGGDYGRWAPDGKLEFLGRRDNQVKIRGFRIEIGEIDNALLAVPGVRDGAVVVAERPDQGKHLVAFYSAQTPIEPELLAGRLAEKLPEYMIPAAFHRRENLPLTNNGKIDTTALRGLAAELAADREDFQPPVTPAELMLAAAYAKVLGVGPDEIGRHDHFFDRGGSSLSAVKLAIATGRARVADGHHPTPRARRARRAGGRPVHRTRRAVAHPTRRSAVRRLRLTGGDIPSTPRHIPSTPRHTSEHRGQPLLGCGPIEMKGLLR